MRASLYDKHYQGYTDNVFLGASNSNTGRQYGGRLALTWQPLDTLRVNLGGIWNRIDSDDNAAVTLGNLTTVTDDGVGLLRGEPTLGEMAAANAFLQPFSKDVDYYSATVVWDAPQELTVTSATSWSRAITHRLQDTTGSYGLLPGLLGLPPGYSDYHVDLDLKKLTQELRVASVRGRSHRMAGRSFLYRRDQRQPPAGEQSSTPITASCSSRRSARSSWPRCHPPSRNMRASAA